jgi:hypothetical protein
MSVKEKTVGYFYDEELSAFAGVAAPVVLSRYAHRARGHRALVCAADQVLLAELLQHGVFNWSRACCFA